MKRWILRYIYKLIGPNKERSLEFHRLYGKFKVQYPDGHFSQPFGFSTAKDYAQIFNGKIIDNF